MNGLHATILWLPLAFILWRHYSNHRVSKDRRFIFFVNRRGQVKAYRVHKGGTGE